MKKIFFGLWMIMTAAVIMLAVTPDLVLPPGHADKAMHVTGFCLLMLYPVCAGYSRKRIIFIALALIAIGVGIEIAQLGVASRKSSLFDALANGVGVILGVVIGYLVRSGYNAPATHTILLALISSCLFFPSAYAQQNPKNKIIAEKRIDHPDFGPHGTRLGAFLVYKGITVTETYDDNIFRDNIDTKSDFITVARPGLLIESDWNLHSLALGAQIARGHYMDNSSENFLDYDVFLTGQIDLDYETYLTGTVEQFRDHEDRGSPEDPNGDEPLEYSTTRYFAGFTRALGYIHAQIRAQYDQVRYENTSNGGVALNQEYRDRNEKSLGAKLAYEFRPGQDIYIDATYHDKAYQLSGPTDRSSTGYDLKAGLDFEVTGKVKGNIYGGRLFRTYKLAFEDLKSNFFGLSLAWDATPLTRLNLLLDQNINETIVAGRSGNIHTRRKIDINHGIFDNISLGSYLGYDDYEYSGGTGARTDTQFYAGAGIDYSLMRGVDLNFDYNYINRESDSTIFNYTDNRVMLGVSYFH
jgi:hypothetical protein